jgi:flagellar biosynthesis protein FlhG
MITVSPAAPVAILEQGPGNLLAVASGKGGVGKTWLAITLAQQSAREGRRVLLFDGDLGLANVDIQLGLMPEHDLGSVITQGLRLEDVILPCPDGGFDVIAGRSGSGSLAALPVATLEAVLAGLRRIARNYDLVLLDLGAGLDRAVRRMAAFADALLVVATEEPTSLTDAYAVLKLFAADRPDGVALVAMNLAANHASGLRSFATLERACERFLGRMPGLVGVIRRDERVREAIRRQALLPTRAPGTPAAEDVAALSRAVLSRLARIAAR